MKSQTNQLSIDYTFDMDLLPVAFESLPNILEDGSYDKANLDEIFNHLVVLIWLTSVFQARRCKNDTKFLSNSFHYAQDKSVLNHVPSSRVRDRSTIEQFECHSKLRLRPYFHSRTLSMSMEHDYHTSFTYIRLSDEIFKFIRKPL